MFKKSNKETQLDAFTNVPTMLERSALKQYSDQGHWHNQFREQVVMRIDESIFGVLFNNTTGAPNAPARTLVGMMILKESFGWSDSQLFEHCRFNLLVRSSLGLFNINDPLPVESTYYLLRKRIYDHQKQNGEDLMGKVFAHITSGQIKEFNVNGRSIRMDSKLIGSNIAIFTRYEIIHQTLCLFYKSLDKPEKSKLFVVDRKQLELLMKEESSKTVYHSTKDELRGRLQTIGILIYNLLNRLEYLQTELYQLLQRVFNEQYKVIEDEQIELRPKEEISSSSLQSPHDPDSAYRNKGDQTVKGYSVNITETCSQDNLNLITNVIVEKANTPDTAFVDPAIEATIEVTGQIVEKVYADGAYQSPNNDACCENIDMVFTGIQGAGSKYDLNMTQEGLLVTDTRTGEQIKAVLVKKHKNSKEDRWRITTPSGYYYFGQLAIRASQLRRQMKGRSLEELHKRNNVEATIFQLSYPLRNNKSKYRGIIKQKTWAYCRCLWINLVRILNFTKQICQRTFKIMELPVFEHSFVNYLNFQTKSQLILSRTYSIVLIFSIITNLYIFK
ncbi:MAG TPA: transposase [Bacteroidales bacterium]|nr:transposase [Bacteroidales bacterium]